MGREKANSDYTSSALSKENLNITIQALNTEDGFAIKIPL
jgi:hypothetical protein